MTDLDQIIAYEASILRNRLARLDEVRAAMYRGEFKDGFDVRMAIARAVGKDLRELPPDGNAALARMRT